MFLRQSLLVDGNQIAQYRKLTQTWNISISKFIIISKFCECPNDGKTKVKLSNDTNIKFQNEVTNGKTINLT